MASPRIPRVGYSEGATGQSSDGVGRVPAESTAPPCTAFLEPVWDMGSDLSTQCYNITSRARARTRQHTRTRGRAWAARGLMSVPLSLFPPRKNWFLEYVYIRYDVGVRIRSV